MVKDGYNYTSYFLFRGRENPVAGRRHQISHILANLEHGVDRGGYEGSLPWSWNPANPADSKHCHHNGNIRGGSVCADPTLSTSYGDNIQH